MLTFSAHSLKTLDNNVEHFIKKHILNLEFIKSDTSAELGQKMHTLIHYYFNNFEIDKIVNSLDEKEKELFENLKNREIFKRKNNFLYSEKKFDLKLDNNGFYCYLTLRYDAIFKENNRLLIYDWKLKNLPKDAEDDLQTIVYLYCASKIFNTKNISIIYHSIEKNEEKRIDFKNEDDYEKRIFDIILKLPKKYLA